MEYIMAGASMRTMWRGCADPDHASTQQPIYRRCVRARLTAQISMHERMCVARIMSRQCATIASARLEIDPFLKQHALERAPAGLLPIASLGSSSCSWARCELPLKRQTS
eukprot:jgi/Ulvmu1/11742/UM008_0155.1